MLGKRLSSCHVSSVTGLDCAICASLAAGTFSTVEEAQEKIYLSHKIYQPDPLAPSVYDRLYPLYRELYFAPGQPNNPPLGRISPELIHISESMSRGKTVSH